MGNIFHKKGEGKKNEKEIDIIWEGLSNQKRKISSDQGFIDCHVHYFLKKRY